MNRISIIEIDLPVCQNVYSQFPCTAPAAEEPCYNCRSTCKDLPNIDEQPETVYFSKPSDKIKDIRSAGGALGVEATIIENIESISYSPPELMLGKSIGVRSSLTVNFVDHRSPDTDNSGDKYVDQRDYDPYTQGTYFGKLRARYPYIKTLPVRWKQGSDAMAYADYDTRHFVLDATRGPDVNGSYSIIAKDILKLTDGERSVVPFVTGLTTSVVFDAAYLGSIGTFADDGRPFFLGDGYVNLGNKEIAQYVRSFPGGGTISIDLVARAQFNTEAVDNSSGNSISLQECEYYDGAFPQIVMANMLISQAGVDPSYISTAEWFTEWQANINRTYDFIFPRPEPVVNIINEILEQTASTMWWDNRAQQIRWQVLKKPVVQSLPYDDQSIVKGSLNIRDDYSGRVSRVFIYFGMINPLKNITDKDNYSTIVLRTELESEKFFGETPAYKEIYSRFIPSASVDTAERLGDLILQRFSFPPRRVAFKLLNNGDYIEPVLGGAYKVKSFEMQDASGLEKVMDFQVTSVINSANYITVKGEEILYNELIVTDTPTVFNYVINTDQFNINLRDDVYNGPFPLSGFTINVTIDTGVVVGSAIDGQPALVSGDWPIGVTVNLTNNGFIVGKGGAGGQGGSVDVYAASGWFALYNAGVGGLGFSAQFTDPTPGGNGGNAIELTYDVNIVNNGTIGGGGGGGAGSFSGVVGFFTRKSFNPPTQYQRYAAAFGPGGTGGAGSFSGNGGQNGLMQFRSTEADRVGSDVLDIKPPITPDISPQPRGGLEDAARGSGSLSLATFSTDDTNSQYTFRINCLPVSGGGLGQSGAGSSKFSPGLDGPQFVNIVNRNMGTPTYSEDETVESAEFSFDDYILTGPAPATIIGGGAKCLTSDTAAISGGQAGDAIVQNGGTAIITNNGSILGDVS